ncbi:MAG: TonB-dependent receptor [Anaerolineales bacterium]|nr:TonB-dependent receptor [Anaerolineales bacterium]
MGKRFVSGAFAQQTLGYKDQVFLTLAGRFDNSSVFAPSNQNNFYPQFLVDIALYQVLIPNHK